MEHSSPSRARPFGSEFYSVASPSRSAGGPSFHLIPIGAYVSVGSEIMTRRDVLLRHSASSFLRDVKGYDVYGL